eukprot:Gb_23437 [translate_table: standard]
MAASSLLTSTSAHSLLHSPSNLLPFHSSKTAPFTCFKVSASAQHNPQKVSQVEAQPLSRRDVALTGLVGLISLAQSSPASAGLDEDYPKDTQAVIDQIKGTIDMDKSDPNRSSAVAALRESSNNWVAKYRREKKLAGKPSYSNMYSVLNALSGHYISFGPTSPIPTKRKARILEEVDTAEKALSKGR